MSFVELADLFSSFSKICEPEDKTRLAFCMYDLDRDCKLDKTDIGNVVLRYVFDMPPLLDALWDKVEPRINVTDYTEEEFGHFGGMVKEMTEGLRATTKDPVTGDPYELDPTHGLLIAAEVNGYVEECLDEASHDVYQPGEPDTRAIHWPEFKKALERNPDFDANFCLPITLPLMSRKQVTESRTTFNIVQDMEGGSDDLDDTDSWIHPMRPTLLSDRIGSYAKISAQKGKKGKKKKKKGDDGDGNGDDNPASPSEEYAAFSHTDGGPWTDFKHWVDVKREMLKQQDPNPLWRRSLLNMEGSFGAGIGAVFRLYRWFFVMNLYIAGTWLVFVMLPVLAVEYGGMKVPSDDIITTINPFNSTYASEWMQDTYLDAAAGAGLDMQDSFSGLGSGNVTAANVTSYASQQPRREMGCDVRCFAGGTCTAQMFLDPVALCGNCTQDPEFDIDVEMCDSLEDMCCYDRAWDWPLSPNGTHIVHNKKEEGKSFNLDWWYYGGYHWHTGLGAPGSEGYEEGLRIDSSYVMVVLGLYIANIVAVIHELAANVSARVRSQSEEKIESMRFTLTKELFGGYQHGLTTGEAVEAHLNGLRKDLKTIMGQKFEKRFTGHQNYILKCIPEMTARRYAGQFGAFVLILVTAVALTVCIGFRRELDDRNKAYQPLILTLVKQVIPLLVKKTVAIEKYVDAEKAMQATVKRVYFLKMFSLVNIFYNNLKELVNEDDSSGLLAISVQNRTCVETELGRAYLRLIMMDMLVGAIKEFILYPKWRVKVRLDRRGMIRKELKNWLTKIGLESKEGLLRKHFGSSLWEPTNIEHVREMEMSEAALALLKADLQLTDSELDKFKKAVNQLKADLARTDPNIDFPNKVSVDEAQLAGDDAELGLDERIQGGGGAGDEEEGSEAETVDNPVGDGDDPTAEDGEDGASRPLPAPPEEPAESDGAFEKEPEVVDAKAAAKAEKARKKEEKERLKNEKKMQAENSKLRKANEKRKAKGGLDVATLDLIEERNKTEYDTDRAAQAAIDMMYRQSLIWVGASLCPVLPFAGLINITIQFFVQYYSMFKSCKPPKTPWSADKTMYFFMQLVLLALLISGAPIVVLLTSKNLSCGPHCSQAAMAQRAPWLLDSADSNRCNPVLSGADYRTGVRTWITHEPFGDEDCWKCVRSTALCLDEGGTMVGEGGSCRDCGAEGFAVDQGGGCSNNMYDVDWDERPCVPTVGEKDGTCLKSLTNMDAAKTTCTGEFCNDEYSGPAFVGAADRWMADKAPLLQETIGAVIAALLTAETMFSILFVSSIAIYFQVKVGTAMAEQINTMGQMLTDEEKERYDIIQTNLAQGMSTIVHVSIIMGGQPASQAARQAARQRQQHMRSRCIPCPGSSCLPLHNVWGHPFTILC
eukprot:COSAG06_NODE_317_length_17666_cov_51.304548_4_plen_1387_part_00